MSVTDAKLNPAAKSVTKVLTVPIITAINQAAVKAMSFTPGHRFEVVSVKVWSTAITATITADVKIGATSVLTGAVTPVAGTEVSGALVASRTARRGSASDALNIEYTTNGTGAGTNLRVTVTYRVYPLNGES